MYGGNRGNGKIAVGRSGWGPSLKQGDRVGMRLEVVKGRAILSFSHNGKGLGPAFNISGLDVPALRPVVSLDKPTDEVSISKSSGGSFTFEPEAGITGKWHGDNFSVRISQAGPGTWGFSLRVINTMFCTVKG